MAEPGLIQPHVGVEMDKEAAAPRTGQQIWTQTDLLAPVEMQSYLSDEPVLKQTNVASQTDIALQTDTASQTDPPVPMQTDRATQTVSTL